MEAQRVALQEQIDANKKEHEDSLAALREDLERLVKEQMDTVPPMFQEGTEQLKKLNAFMDDQAAENKRMIGQAEEMAKQCKNDVSGLRSDVETNRAKALEDQAASIMAKLETRFKDYEVRYQTKMKDMQNEHSQALMLLKAQLATVETARQENAASFVKQLSMVSSPTKR